MTNNEIEKLQELIHDREKLEVLMESIEKDHWIKIMSPEIKDGFELYFFDKDFKTFLKNKYDEANKIIEQIELKGLNNDD